MVVDDILLECVAVLIGEVGMHVGVVGVYLAAALVYGHEHRLNARCGLRHDANGAGWGNGEAGNVAAAIFLHLLIHGRAGLPQAVDEWVGCLACCVVNLESTTLFGKVHR